MTAPGTCSAIPRCAGVALALVFVGFLEADVVAAADSEAASGRASARLYQPEDSIALATLQRLPGDESSHGTVRISDDGQWIAFVAHRGSAGSGLTEYRVYIYDSAAVRAFASGRGGAPPPRWIALFETDGNFPAVRDFRWLAGGPRLAIIGERRDGLPPQRKGTGPQLHILDASTGQLERATDTPDEVLACDVAAATVLCLTAMAPAPVLRFNVSTAHVLEDDLFGALQLGPRADDRDRPVRVGVYIRNGAAPGRIVAESTNRALREQLKVRLSSTAQQAVVTWPLERIQPGWLRYDVASDFERLAQGDLPPPERYTQFALVDITKGSLRPAIDAPTGDWISGSFAPTDALWLPHGRSVILSSTYLPAPAAEARQNAGRDPDESHLGPAIVELNADDLRFRVIARLPVLHAEDFEHGWPQHVRSMSLSDDGTKLELALTAATRAGDRSGRYWRFDRSPDGDWGETAEDERPPAGPPTVFEEESLTAAPRVAVRVDDAASSRILLETNGHLRGVQLGEVREITWNDPSGRTWRGGLVVPPAGARAAAPYPLVIQTHGFPRNEFLIDGPMSTGYAAQGLAARGIAVLQIGDAYDVMDTAEEAPTHMAAYESGIEFLEKQNLVDGSRVGLMGFSRTCYHVKYALTHSSRKFAAALTADGVDFGYWQYLLNATGPQTAFAEAWRRLAERLNAGAPFGPGLGTWSIRAPTFNAQRITAPLSIVALTADTVLGQWETYAALKILGRPVEMFVIPDAPHELVRPGERLTAMENTIDWFDFWLNGHEDAGIGKADRYSRWRRLRELSRTPDRLHHP